MPLTIALDPLGLDRPLAQAIEIERASLSRSNGARRPFFFTTVSSRSCTRSKVVKRAAAGRAVARRRRIAALSSVGRMSFTWVSSWPQNGQRISVPLFGLLALSVA